jgi:hypothetical protein
MLESYLISSFVFSEDSVEEIVPPDTKIDADDDDLHEEDDDNKEEDEDEREKNAADEIRLKKPTPGTE